MNQMNNPINDLMKAFTFAANAHKDQRRKGNGGAPYINHLIEVAYLLTDVENINDIGIIQAAILHDVLEDTNTEIDVLLANFGERVSQIVISLTDDKSHSLEQRRKDQLAHLSSAPTEIKLIKLADHCSNISSIPSNWDNQRIESYLQWSKAVATLCFDASDALAKAYLSKYEQVVSK